MRVVLVSLFFLSLAACRTDPYTPTKDAAPVQVVPAGWPDPQYRFDGNSLSQKKFELGRALFFEPMLSRNNSISCGSCHQPFAAFAHSGHRLSHGIHERLGNRNSPALFNLAWHPSFMHDGGVNHIEVQPLAPISNPVEMDETIGRVLEKLAADERYRRMFRDAYGSEEITSERFLKAMAQFMGLMTSFNSRFDRYKRGEGNVKLSEEELRGYRLFADKCNSCHAEPLFSDFAYRSNGLAVNPAVNDSGRARITRKPGDLYRFKTPSLRNLVFTAPYMHDGSLGTLEECLDHYEKGIFNRQNLDPLLDKGIPMTAGDKKDLISFLRTLTDHTFNGDERFAMPRSR
jgi:cytochrome c peroxidase